MTRPAALDDEVAGLDAVHVGPADGGHGGRLLFVHGMFGGAWVWERVLDYFAARGWDCWAVTLRGHRRVPGPEVGRLRLADDVADVTRAAAALDHPVLIGHSLGGLLVLKVAEQTNPPAVVALRSLALLAAAIRHSPAMLRGRVFLPSRRTMNRLAFNRLDPAGRERVWRRIVPESGRQALDVAVPGVAIDPRRLTCPRLVVSAGVDRLTPASMVRKIARRYGTECFHYEALGHMVTLEPGWPAVAADVADWLVTVRNAAEPAVTGWGFGGHVGAPKFS